jgi:hypothetical protein
VHEIGHHDMQLFANGDIHFPRQEVTSSTWCGAVGHPICRTSRTRSMRSERMTVPQMYRHAVQTREQDARGGGG